MISAEERNILDAKIWEVFPASSWRDPEPLGAQSFQSTTFASLLWESNDFYICGIGHFLYLTVEVFIFLDFVICSLLQGIIVLFISDGYIH